MVMSAFQEKGTPPHLESYGKWFGLTFQKYQKPIRERKGQDKPVLFNWNTEDIFLSYAREPIGFPGDHDCLRAACHDPPSHDGHHDDGLDDDGDGDDGNQP